MLRQRVLSAAALLPLVLAAAWAGGWWFTLFVAAFAVLAAWELFSLLGRTERKPVVWLGLLIVAWLVLETALPPDPERFQMLLAFSILLGLTTALAIQRPLAASDWTLTLGAALYVGFTLRFLASLRLLPNDGLGWVALAALTTWVTDSGAYFIGKAIGRHKLSPRISPKKTWEGVLGGLAVGIPTAALLAPILAPGLTWLQGALVGLVIGIVGPLGDLSESLFKRQVGAKDSSNLIPGHGGFFDRVDSFFFVAPVVYFLAKWWGW